MKSISLKSILAGIALFAMGAASTLVAQTMTDSAQRVERQRADLSGAAGMEVITSVGEYKPGDSINLHIHHGIEAAYVIQGATIQAGDREPAMLPTGASVLNLRDVKHGGFKVVGETSLKLFTVHVVDKAKPLYDYSQ